MSAAATEEVDGQGTPDMAALLGQLREANALVDYFKQRNIDLSAALSRLGTQVADLQNRLTELDPDWNKTDADEDGDTEPVEDIQVARERQRRRVVSKK